MKTLKQCLKNEKMVIIAALCAAASALWVPPSPRYLEYLNWPVLTVLFCLMAVVAGFRSTGVFGWLSGALLSRAGDVRRVGIILVLLCFFLAMLITNDVALLTLVPLTMGLFPEKEEDRLIFIIVMETAAANLGSIVTPVGNPQNLYLFSAYGMDAASFFRVTLPLGGVSLGLVLAVTLVGLRPGTAGGALPPGEPAAVDRRRALIYLALFMLCLLTVFQMVSGWLCLGAVLAVILAVDRRVLGRVDYMLLLTFVCFFIFVGNIARIGAVRTLVSSVLAGHEMLTAALISQVISNVPAAIMLSSFTQNARALVAGVNIGGLGTLVASLASLISCRLYCAGPGAKRSRYLAVFSTVNFALLAVLLVLASWMF